MQAQGDYAAVRPYYERALAIREQALGPLHPTTAQSLNNLGFLLYYEKNYAGALPLIQRVLVIRQQRLGPDHPDTQGSAQSLAVIEQAAQAASAPRPAQIAAQAQEAAAAALEGETEDELAALAARLEEVAQQAEADEVVGSPWLDLAVYLRQLRGYLELAGRAEQHVARLAEGGEAERSAYAVRFTTAAAAYDGGDAAALAVRLRLRRLAAGDVSHSCSFIADCFV